MTKYNGWTNYETWLVNLWYDGYFNDVAEDYRDDVQGLADYIQNTIEEGENLPTIGLVADLVNAALSKVDWYEIAEHYIADLPELE